VLSVLFFFEMITEAPNKYQKILEKASQSFIPK